MAARSTYCGPKNHISGSPGGTNGAIVTKMRDAGSDFRTAFSEGPKQTNSQLNPLWAY